MTISSATQVFSSNRLAANKLRPLWYCPLVVTCSAVVANVAIAYGAVAAEFTPTEFTLVEETAIRENALEEISIEESILEEETSSAVFVLEAITPEESDFEEIFLADSALEETVLEENILEDTVLKETNLEEPVVETAVETAVETVSLEEFTSEAIALESSPLQPAVLDSSEMSQSPWLSQSDISQADTTESTDAPPKYGTAGEQRWYLQSGVGLDFDDDAFGLVGAGVTHFFYDYHSLSLELNGLYFDQPGDNAAGLNLNLLLRSHWIRGDNWTLYVDGGAGILQSTDGVPSIGSTFNFTPQVGGGATFALNEDDTKRLMVGMRWHHTSSADTFQPNPGLDVLLGYVGINFPL